jgi:hypothetical protein
MGSILGRHHEHLPRHQLNKAAQGIGSVFGRQVVKAQGQQTKADAKTPPRYRGKK